MEVGGGKAVETVAAMAVLGKVATEEGGMEEEGEVKVAVVRG